MVTSHLLDIDTTSDGVSDSAGRTQRPLLRNRHIQHLRAIAALTVVLFHASAYLNIVYHDDRFLRWIDYRFGLYAVTLFFAISGYLMAGVVRRQDASTFLFHRIVRIYPTFLIAVGLSWLAYRIAGMSFDVDWIGLTLIPFGKALYPLHVEWTLVFEVVFYVILFGVIALRLQSKVVYMAALWAVSIFVKNVVWKEQSAQNVLPLHLMMVSVANSGFLGGVLARHIAKWNIPVLVAAVFCAGCILFGGHMSYAAHQWAASIGVTALLASLVNRPARAGSALEHCLTKMGDYSYALYLLHVPVILVTYAALGGANTSLSWAVAVTVAVLLSIPVGMLDVALYASLKRSVDRSPLAWRRGFVALFLVCFFGIAGYGSVFSIWTWVEARPRLKTGMKIEHALHGSSEADLKQAAEAVGLVPAVDIIGSIDLMRWMSGPVLLLGGWAADNKDFKPVDILVFQAGRLIASFAPDSIRPDVAAALQHQRLATIRTGFSFGAAVSCQPGQKAVLVAVDRAGRFGVLGSGKDPQACPAR